MFQKIVFSLFLLSSTLFGAEITIFAASDLRFALDRIKSDFTENYPDAGIKIIYGSSGKGRVQIERGAPYDIYFSANMEYVKELYKRGEVATAPKLYAIGRIVIWSKNSHFEPKKGFANLQAPWVERIAIANPSHAPYGMKAKEALKAKHLYNSLKPKIVFGENISQTANYVNIQVADIGIIALSLVLAPDIANSPYNHYTLIDTKLYKPLQQGYSITTYGKHSKLAHRFYNYMQSSNAKKIMKKYGFSVTE